jgi:hypothetical protein
MGIIFVSNIEEAAEDGSNVNLVKLVLSLVEGIGEMRVFQASEKGSLTCI